MAFLLHEFRSTNDQVKDDCAVTNELSLDDGDDDAVDLDEMMEPL